MMLELLVLRPLLQLRARLLPPILIQPTLPIRTAQVLLGHPVLSLSILKHLQAHLLRRTQTRLMLH